MLAAACIAIRLESRGSPIYRQRRVGKEGAPFDLYKLRTMVSGAERMGAGLAVDEGDPRITRVGALLRRFSLDELPNLLNVLRGEMSLVGPRPTVQVQVAQYTPRQLGRLAVEPGITGWAQVQGTRGAAVARADRARPLVRRALVAAARPAHPRRRRRGCCSSGKGLYRGDDRRLALTHGGLASAP